jgi:hypothetical protein
MGAAVLVVVVGVALFAGLVVRSQAKPFWYDEIYTIVGSQLPSISALWTAQREGLDQTPPLNTLATRLVHSVMDPGPITTRLPPMLGFGLAFTLVFVIVRRRANTALALAGALLLCFTAAYRYAYEARGYGLTLGLFALALFAWAEAASGRRRRIWLPVLALSLAAGVWAHYVFVFAWLPIAVGEIVRVRSARQWDRGVFMAMGAGAVALAPLLLLLDAARPLVGSFWARQETATVGGTYAFLLSSFDDWRFLVAGAVIVAAALIGRFVTVASRPSAAPLPRHEVAAGLVAVALPVVAIAASALTGVGFVPRYVLFATVAVGVAAPILAWHATGRSRAAAMLTCGVFVWVFAESVVDAFRPAPDVVSAVQARSLFLHRLAAAEPIVASGSLTFLQLWYYTPPEWRGQLVYLADPALARRFTGADTIDTNYLALARWVPLPIQSYSEFIAARSSFTVYAYGSGWLLAELAERGATIDEQAREGGAQVLTVRLKR